MIDRTKIAGSCQDAGHEPYKTFDLIDRGLDVYTIVLGCVFFFLDNAFEGWLHFTLDFAIRQLGDFILTKIAFFFLRNTGISTRDYLSVALLRVCVTLLQVLSVLLLSINTLSQARELQ